LADAKGYDEPLVDESATCSALSRKPPLLEATDLHDDAVLGDHADLTVLDAPHGPLDAAQIRICRASRRFRPIAVVRALPDIWHHQLATHR
jgi:hypothetical protein